MDKILKNKLEFIKKTYKIYGIILIGSARDILEKPKVVKEGLSDVDVLVVTEESDFEREVVYEGSAELDISYMPMKDLTMALEKEIHSVIGMIGNSREYYLNSELQIVYNKIIKRYKEGPKEVTDEYKRYRKFDISKKHDTLKRRQNSLEFELLYNEYIKELLQFYYQLNKKWIPSDKNLFKGIDECAIKEKLENLYSCKNDKENRLTLLEEIRDNILGAVGGELHVWEKSKYPFDFK